MKGKGLEKQEVNIKRVFLLMGSFSSFYQHDDWSGESSARMNEFFVDF